MRKGVAKAEENNKGSLTIPCRTRSPLEAFRMLEVGQNVDAVAGYYFPEGRVPEDFYMMDKVQKLSKLAEFKEMAQNARNEHLKQEADALAEAERLKALEMEEFNKWKESNLNSNKVNYDSIQKRD